MKHFRVFLPFLGLLFLSVAPWGCATKPQPADPQLARETLKTVLDTWKSGEGLDTLQQLDTPIQVSDAEWARGVRLLDYQVEPRDYLFGTDLRCRVKLTLQGKNGKKRQKMGTYSVGTTQALMVFREDDDY
jgi:hypothetical protein